MIEICEIRSRLHSSPFRLLFGLVFPSKDLCVELTAVAYQQVYLQRHQYLPVAAHRFSQNNMCKSTQ